MKKAARAGLSHVERSGRAKMVDVSGKAVTTREARARGFVRMKKEALALAKKADSAKGDVLAVARLAGIMGAKRTPDLIPLCHPLQLTDVEVNLGFIKDGIEIQTLVKTQDRTGVEMEALVAASIAALTVYDMCKAADKSISIETVELISKFGGKSGDWKRDG